MRLQAAWEASDGRGVMIPSMGAWKFFLLDGNDEISLRDAVQFDGWEPIPKPEPKHWSEEAAGLIGLHGRFDKPEGTMARWIREAHDAACKPREPDYEAMARTVLAFSTPVATYSLEYLMSRLREADGGGR